MAEEQREMPVIRAVGVKKLYKQRGGHRIGGRKSDDSCGGRRGL